MITDEEIVKRVNDAVETNPVSAESLLKLMEVAATAGSYGIKPEDIIQLIGYTYSHHDGLLAFIFKKG